VQVVRYLFKDCTVDTDRREIQRGKELVSAGPQVFDLLLYLIRNRHRVVSKDDLLQALWGGRIVSDSTLASYITAVRKAIGDSGDEQRLIRTVPRKGVRFIAEVQEDSLCTSESAANISAAIATGSNALPDRPSIAVLPFTNMSGDAKQDYFADGMTEDIITELSRMRWLLVIARNSTFTYKGRGIDVKQVGRELGVRYALEGSVRQANDRVRITAQLIDATTGAHLWADRFDGTLDNIFELQDRVAASVVTTIAPKLEQVENERVKRKPTKDLNAYDCFLRGMAIYYQYTKEANTEALRLFKKAIEIDPDFAAAYGMAAQCYGQRYGNRWMINPSEEVSEATRLARKAIELGWDDATALYTGGWALDFVARDPQAGAVFVDRACALNPNLAAAWLASGWARVHLRDPESAIPRFANAMRLSPLEPRLVSMQTGTAFAHFFAGRTAEALSWAERGLREGRTWLPTLHIGIVSNALAGSLDRARNLLVRLRELDSTFSLSSFNDLVYFARPEDLARFAEGFRKAGLRE
jgi:TolB-like protein/tetratricopeptide (TPR) repeat protein